MTVGVVIPDITNPLFPRIVRGIDDELHHHGFTSLLANTDGRPERADEAFDRMLQRGVDGLIIATAAIDDTRPTELDRQSVPVVLVNRRSADLSLPSVTAAGIQGTRSAVNWLVDHGHERVVVLAASRATSTGQQRLDEVETVANARTGQSFEALEAESVSEAEGFRLTTGFVSRDVRPTAIIAANDLMALGAVRAIRAAGLRCPEDVSVVGFNDMPFSSSFDPPLSTIRFDHYAMGVSAAELIVRRISGDTGLANVELPTQWVPRGTTAAAHP